MLRKYEKDVKTGALKFYENPSCRVEHIPMIKYCSLAADKEAHVESRRFR